MAKQHPITPPPPHLLKKFSAQAQAEANKRNGTGYLKTVATLCIEWFVNSQSTSNDRQIRSSEITPPPELVHKWALETEDDHQPTVAYSLVGQIAAKAAQWGADQELEACCKDIIEIIAGVFADQVIDDWDQFVELLRDGRRPQPPSLKEQAFDALHGIHDQGPTPEQVAIIRRALEALDD